MKIKWSFVLYFWNVIAWAALFVLLIDLAALDHIGKYEEIWWKFCHDAIDKSKFACMVDYDVIGIFCAIFVLIFSTYKLAPIYKKQLIVTPLEGGVYCIVGLANIKVVNTYDFYVKY